MKSEQENNGASQSQTDQTQTHTEVNPNVFVRERDFKTEATHLEAVNGICWAGNDEFLTSSADCSLKLWDKFTQGVAYTYEMHEPLAAMNVTGEHGELLVCGQGDGHLIMFGLREKNQLDIVQWAHAQRVTQVVSLGKLKNKYFATRCGDGHVNIYSSLAHPDRIAQLFNFDGDEDALAHLQPKEEVVEEAPKKRRRRRKREEGEEGEEGEGDEEEGEYDDEEGEEEEEEAPQEENEDDEEKKDQKPKVEPPVAPLLVGRPEPSERDRMIEITTKALIQSSSTMLAVSCFNEKQVLICNVDIKTRSRSIKQTFKTENNPTYLYQIDDDHLLVGTSGQNFEIWNIDPTAEQAKFVSRVHSKVPNAEEGPSQIVKLENPSPMITDGVIDDEQSKTQFLVTTATDAQQILIWKLVTRSDSQNRFKLSVHIIIKTSFSEGIKFVLQTSPTQLVAVDNHNKLMFYDFVDKADQLEEAESLKSREEFAKLVESAFYEADSDGNGWLDLDECKPICQSLIRSYGSLLTNDQKEVLLEKMFEWLDADNSGKIMFFEFKVALMRAYVKRELPEDLIGAE